MKKEIIIFQALVIIPIIAMTFIVWWRMRKQRIEKERREEAFLILLLNSFSNEAIIGVEDLVAFYHAHFRTFKTTVGDYRHIYSFLEKMQLRISYARHPDPRHELTKRLPELRDLMGSVMKVLEVETKKIPFYGTPDPERELLEDILELTTSDKDIVNTKYRDSQN